jgi:hypothetical protein
MGNEMRRYECDFYTVMAPDRSCLFCDRCTDVFWDFTHGPYMFVCSAGADTSFGVRGDCPSFSEEGR